MNAKTIARMAVAAVLMTGGTVAAVTTPASAHTPPVSTWCSYRVTSTTGLNVRSHHFTTSPILRVLPYNSTVLAGADGTATGSNLTWRQIGGGGWAAAMYLQRISGNCVV